MHSKTPQEILLLLDDGHLTVEESLGYLQAIQSDTNADSDQDQSLAWIQYELKKAVLITDATHEITPQFKNEIISRIENLLRTDETVSDEPSQCLNTKTSEYESKSNPKSDSIPSSEQELEIPFLSPAQAPDAIGHLGQYRIIRKLGEGGMGLVFEAVDTQLNRRVALKTLLPKLAKDENCRQRFVKEAQAAAMVEHDFLCPIYHIGEGNGIPFIAMPFLVGETLASAIQRRRFSLLEVLKIGIQITKGLDAAHSSHLVHRDIKPSNIWLENRSEIEPDRVKILDFGLARFTSDKTDLTHTGSVIGTPCYMSPEQARSQPIDSRSDLFSLGIVFYEMLTQSRPFVGDTPLLVMTSLIMDKPKAPKEVDPTIPEELSQLVMQLMSKSPEHRPQTANDVVARLQDIFRTVNNTQADITPATDKSKFVLADRTPMRIAPWIALIVIGILVVCCGVIIFQNQNGTLVIQYDGEADIRLRDGGIQIFDTDNKLKYTLSPSEKNRTISPGSYRVKVVGADGLKLETDSFEMKKAGIFTLRAFVKDIPLTELVPAKPDNFESIMLDEKFFPGRLVVSDDFLESSRSIIPISANRTVENHRFIAVHRECKLNDIMPIQLGPELDSGAIYIRCRGVNGRVFLNFSARKHVDSTRWLGLNNPKMGQWDINIHRKNRENGTWIQKPSTRVESRLLNPDQKIGDWVEIAVRQSPESYDVWLNKEYVAGGPLPTAELVGGKPISIEICAIAVSPGELYLEIDCMGIWDQSGLDENSVLPAGLSRSVK